MCSRGVLLNQHSEDIVTNTPSYLRVNSFVDGMYFNPLHCTINNLASSFKDIRKKRASHLFMVWFCLREMIYCYGYYLKDSYYEYRLVSLFILGLKNIQNVNLDDCLFFYSYLQCILYFHLYFSSYFRSHCIFQDVLSPCALRYIRIFSQSFIFVFE